MDESSAYLIRTTEVISVRYIAAGEEHNTVRAAQIALLIQWLEGEDSFEILAEASLLDSLAEAMLSRKQELIKILDAVPDETAIS